MATTTITITHDTQSQCPLKASDDARQALRKVVTLCEGLAQGAYKGTGFTASQDPATGTVTLEDVGGTAASGTITFSSSTGAWTATVNGVAFNGTSAGDDDAEGDILATAINGDATLEGVVTAENAAGVVTITAVSKGTGGNAITLAVTGTGVTRSAATLAGGVNGLVTITVNGTAEATTTTNLTDTAAAALCATELNANATIAALVTATSSAGVVTLTANDGGVSGNAITLAATSATGTATAGAAKLAGGTSLSFTL